MFGCGGGGSEDNGASGGGGGYSGGGSGTRWKQAGGEGGSYCNGEDCSGLAGGNANDDGPFPFNRIVRLIPKRFLSITVIFSKMDFLYY